MHDEETRETILAFGHQNIQATHRATFEITKEHHVSKNGDCIVAVSANKGLSDLSSEFTKKLEKKSVKLTILIEAGEDTDTVNASGSPHLILTHPTDMVIRRSDYVCSRTLAVKADKAACDLSKKLVAKLKDPRQKVRITLTVKV